MRCCGIFRADRQAGYDDLSLSAEFNAPFDTVISPSAQYLGANSKGNDPVSNQESLFTQVLRAQLAEKEAESVKQKEQHGMAALFGKTSQNPHFFDEGLSKDNLLQSDDEKNIKRSEQSDPQNPTAHSIKTTQTANFFSAGLSMDILVRPTGFEPAAYRVGVIRLSRKKPRFHADFGYIAQD